MPIPATRLTLARAIRPALLALCLPGAAAGQAPSGSVSGRVTVAERGDKAAADVVTAVVWLEAVRAGGAVPSRDTIRMVTQDKEFRPRVILVPQGGTVVFPNTDAFDHNVFSLSPEAPFDLGLFGRGQSKAVTFPKAGLIRVYCNVHPQMSAFIVVRDAPWYTQPRADGSFAIQNVPPGDYLLHVWHERGGAMPGQAVRVAADSPVSGLDLRLDARGYKFVQHLNKFGQPYARRGRRY